MTEITITQPIKLIAIDLDGTLLNSNHEMTERTETVLKTALSKGIRVIIATGKTFLSSRHIVKRLGTNTPGIYNQGTITFNSDGTVHSQQVIDKVTARQVITYAEDRGYIVGVYSGTRILVRKLTQRMQELTTYFHEPMPEAVGPLQNILETTPVNKIIIFYPHDPRRVQALRWQLSMQIDTGTRLLSAGIPDELELLPTGASKGSALKVLLKEMGIPASQVMALGDGENDVEMLELAGIGVAMGNASEHVKSIANVTTKTNDEDGVAEAVEKYVLAPLAKAAEAAAVPTPTPNATTEPASPASKVEASPIA
ncbi:MAG: Cof-type HAD-IIB family hydrolase [Chloroflexi bacterium]|nr:Cof-type HAD-IIB family hydrolase [Chloroflexota bacterium]